MSETATPYLNTVSPDANVEQVRAKLLLRSQVGLQKYGVTTQRNDLDLIAWAQHLQEELLDAAVYTERLMQDLLQLKEIMANASRWLTETDPNYNLAEIENELERLEIGDLEK